MATFFTLRSNFNVAERYGRAGGDAGASIKTPFWFVGGF